MKAPARSGGGASDRLVLVAHGTRDPEGQAVLETVRELVALRLPRVDVRLAHVDVVRPRLDEVLVRVPDAIVVPLFLGAGYHVRTDVPRAVAATGGRARVTPLVGSSPVLLRAVAHRLDRAGPLPEAIVLAAAGSRDSRAVDQVRSAATGLHRLLGRPVVAGFAATGSPAVGDAVRGLREAGARSVGVASYLLAPGVFQRRLQGTGADLVSAPIGAHPLLVDLVVDRFRAGQGWVDDHLVPEVA